jgi:DNA-binding SARP family transcriptional activator
LTLRVQVLGPVRAWREGREVDLGSESRRAVLALLAMAQGHPVSRAELVDALWGGQPPATVVNVIHTHVKHLRRSLEPKRPVRAPSTVLPSVGDGYALQLSTVDLDLVRFRRLVSTGLDAYRAGDPRRAGELLGEALSLWHGPPLVDLAVLAGHPRTAALAGERWAAVASYGEAMLAADRPADAIPALAEAAAAQPLNEAVHARLIRAYRAVGRLDQALDTYRAVRRRLAEELGLDPGPELAAVHAGLGADHPGNASRPATPVVVPAQLPADTAAFTGRVEQLRRLDELASNGAHPPAVVIAGTAGVGKTSLAVHWAHRMASQFPDGQLFVDLRGFGPSGSVMGAGEAVRGFLEALGVPPQRFPTTLEAQAGLYRSLLAGRRILVVLDNARDAEQVRPLLPGSPGSLAVMTSRNQLTGLVAADGAALVGLDLLAAAEGRELLERRLGQARVAAEPAAVAEIVDRCAGLPLALAVVAARATARAWFELAAVASELREDQGGLDRLTGGDVATDVRAVFSWSYQALGPEPARLFRLLAVHPGPDISAPAAASLAGVPVGHARGLLAELTGAHLLAEPVSGRYRLHDLLRSYAAELAGVVDGDRERRAGRRRLLDHYLHTAGTASSLFDPHRSPIEPGQPDPAVTPEPLADHGQALAWFTREHRVLVAAVNQAVGTGFDAHGWQLAWALVVFLHRHGHWHDWVDTQQAALRAARRVGEPSLLARMHRGNANALAQLGRYEQAHAHFRDALDLLEGLGDKTGRAHTQLAFAGTLEREGRHGEALVHAGQGLDLFGAVGDRPWQARALNAVGWFQTELGNHREAITACREALALQEEIGDRNGQALTWDTIGLAYQRLGDYQPAVSSFEQALALHRATSHRYYEAETLGYLGDTHRAAGDAEAARAAWKLALSILDEIGDSGADDLRAKLSQASERVR